MATDIEARVRRMAAGLEIPSSEIDTAHLLPVFAPAAFFAAGAWCGPHIRLRTGDLGLTWAVLQPDAIMRYVNHDMQAHWDTQGIDWKKLAMRNLAAATNDQDGAQTLCRADGHVYAIAFMYEDGFGTSRLLLRDGLERMFPEGYGVALPERSCGFAFSVNLSAEETGNVMDTVDDCFRDGAYPLVPGSYAASDLLPED
jgi:hypothetical protein